MRKYDIGTEQNVRQAKMVREWAASGFLQTERRDHMLADLTTDVRTTNPFFRLILLVFTILIVVASVLLVGTLLDMRRDGANAALCMISAVVSIFLAETFVSRFRLYRFGVEEALAILSVVLAGVGAAFAVQGLGFSALAVTAVAAWGIFLRYGYLVAAAGALLSLSAIPFKFDISSNVAHLLSAAALCAIWFVARRTRRTIGDEFPGDEYGFIEAFSWMAAYAFLNLQLIPSSFVGLPQVQPESLFYWFTYAMTWLLPAAGLYLAIRDRHRSMLDVNLCLALITLITNKAYLHQVRRTMGSNPIWTGSNQCGSCYAALDQAGDERFPQWFHNRTFVEF